MTYEGFVLGKKNVSDLSGVSVFSIAAYYGALGQTVRFHDGLAVTACCVGGNHKRRLSLTGHAASGISASGRRQQWLLLFLLRVFKAGYFYRLSVAQASDGAVFDSLYAGRVSGVCSARLCVFRPKYGKQKARVVREYFIFNRRLLFSYAPAGDVCELYAVSACGPARHRARKIPSRGAVFRVGLLQQLLLRTRGVSGGGHLLAGRKRARIFLALAKDGVSFCRTVGGAAGAVPACDFRAQARAFQGGGGSAVSAESGIFALQSLRDGTDCRMPVSAACGAGDKGLAWKEPAFSGALLLRRVCLAVKRNPVCERENFSSVHTASHFAWYAGVEADAPGTCMVSVSICAACLLSVRIPWQ